MPKMYVARLEPMNLAVFMQLTAPCETGDILAITEVVGVYMVATPASAEEQDHNGRLWVARHAAPDRITAPHDGVHVLPWCAFPYARLSEATQKLLEKAKPNDILYMGENGKFLLSRPKKGRVRQVGKVLEGKAILLDPNIPNTL